MTEQPIRISFVCLGNICRSPMADAVARQVVEARGLSDRVRIDSAGTAGYHEGEGAHHQTDAALRRRGFPVGHVARRFRAEDFAERTLVVALDQQNAADLRRLAPDAEQAAKVVLLRDFDPSSPPGSIVPDPWGGPDADFDHALDLIEAAVPGLIDHVTGDGPG